MRQNLALCLTTPAPGEPRADANLFSIYANALLVEAGVRSSFLLQAPDFAESHIPVPLLNRLASEGYALVLSRQGVLVCLPAQEAAMTELVQLTDRTGNPRYLGLALSYPAAADFPAAHERGRMAMSWTVADGRGSRGLLMTNVFRKPALLADGIALCNRMDDALAPAGLRVRLEVRKLRAVRMG